MAQAHDVTVSCGAALVETGGICHGTISRSDSVQQFNVELRLSGTPASISGIPVVFRPDSGSMLHDSVVTNASGVARAIWYRPRGAGPAGIAADIRTPTGSMLKYIQLRPRETSLRLRTAQDARIVNFPGGTGRRLIVEILRVDGTNAVAITDSAQCASHRVAFIPEGTGARVTPDTAAGVVYDAKPRGSAGGLVPGCFAGARLAVGSDVGLHEIRTVGVAPIGYRVVENARLHAINVRHLPQIIVAGVLSHHSSFQRVDKETTRTYRVQRVLPSGETATFDSSVVKLSPDDGGGWSTTAMVGFSTPIPLAGALAPASNHFNLTFGLDPVEPRRGQFVGISVLRSTGLVPYNFPVDIHMLAHAQHRDILKDPSGCVVALTVASCETESRVDWGPAFAVSFDASAVIAEAIKKLSI